ncbi:N-acetylglucosamine-6-sulfatase-like [Octopus vulgaris]|uniref:N-acetylglucosamine-6-sulfatase-like n=1 Tax=Octopus vulgaris TaxID=6645 RepID=A0AA36B1I7_OCTVU|nr:N-acetylglucosamine-6-sulfatase-like [Octopus vulgaris]
MQTLNTEKMSCRCVSLFFISLYVCSVFHLSYAIQKPNIIFILTDDQDLMLGGMTPMLKTKKLIGDAGITFNNMFVTSPLCCPSRSSFLTGKYTHNHRVLNNSLSGNCSSALWQKYVEPTAFPVKLNQNGYKTFFAGKYLNQYGKKHAGGVKHIPPGWTSWNGLVGNSKYYNYSMSTDGVLEKHGCNYSIDYLTDIINHRAVKFINEHKGNPFFMMLSTPAAHSPFTPAPQYSKNFSTRKAPRDKSFNKHSTDKHWLIRQAISPMSNSTIELIDNIFRNRWRTLLSVDDLVENIVKQLTATGLLNNTYIFFTSDNGYHLGQFSLPYDKRQLYDFDNRVPFLVRGPGIKANQTRNELVLNIDFAPTFLSLAGIKEPGKFDGKSLQPLLTANKTDPKFRNNFLIEHSGEFHEEVKNCPQYKNQGMSSCDINCVCEDSWNNTYGCIRNIDSKNNFKYCEFNDKEHFIEMYDLEKDAAEITNIAKSADPNIVLHLSQTLATLSLCSGPSCQVD